MTYIYSLQLVRVSGPRHHLVAEVLGCNENGFPLVEPVWQAPTTVCGLARPWIIDIDQRFRFCPACQAGTGDAFGDVPEHLRPEQGAS